MRIGHITEAVKFLIFAASVIITCMLVFLGFQAAETASQISDSATQQMAELNNDIKDRDIKMYDNNEVEGSLVRDFIGKHLGEYSDGETAPIYVYVKTTTSENTYVNGTCKSDISDFTKENFIKPQALFNSKVIKNENNVIVGVSFIQK